MTKREPDAYCIYYKDVLQDGFISDSRERLLLLIDDMFIGDNKAAHDCLAQRNGWQIRPVWLSTEPPEGWISVKERLPEEEGYYWGYNGDKVFLVDFTPDAICKDGIFDCDGFSIGEDNFDAGDIVAWMRVGRPLPPKPEKE